MAAALAAASAALSAGQVAAASGSLSTASPRQPLQRGQPAGSSAVLVAARLSRDDQSAAQCSAFSASEMFGGSAAAALRQQPLCATPVARGSQHRRPAIVCKVRRK
ncbi:hypothetical protein CBR_g31072 [Chara braunii]|uniref:Uncharacterized protein n=1 Tax=Chara braunii TaxID=69332 RepID=A0A388LEH4_CHABU|nr:hypothetical protein CBR_g31072 [Chara braunii]|eukprot:GBG80612.1 hypothetical protein CBR_g31072 [Chara braunii]